LAGSALDSFQFQVGVVQPPLHTLALPALSSGEFIHGYQRFATGAILTAMTALGPAALGGFHRDWPSFTCTHYAAGAEF
jgi:hypothetical protein